MFNKNASRIGLIANKMTVYAYAAILKALVTQAIVSTITKKLHEFQKDPEKAAAFLVSISDWINKLYAAYKKMKSSRQASVVYAFEWSKLNHLLTILLAALAFVLNSTDDSATKQKLEDMKNKVTEIHEGLDDQPSADSQAD